MRLGECGVVAWWGSIFSADRLPPAWVTSGDFFPDRLQKPHIDFRFEVCVSRLPVVRGQTPCRRPRPAAATSEAVFMSPSIAPSLSIAPPSIPPAPIPPAAPALLDPAAAAIAPATARIPASGGTWNPERIEQLKSCV